MTDRRERRRKILDLRNQGWTYAAIAREFKLSNERIRQLVAAERREQEREARWTVYKPFTPETIFIKGSD